MIQLDQQHAQRQLDQMHCTIQKKFVLPTIWQANKLLRHLTSGLFVEEPGINTIKKLINLNERVILIPQYKSFADLFVLHYAL